MLKFSIENIIENIQTSTAKPSPSEFKSPSAARTATADAGDSNNARRFPIQKHSLDDALNLTSNNRASAAEILGLSRQSLYSKLNRFGLGSSEPDSSSEN